MSRPPIDSPGTGSPSPWPGVIAWSSAGAVLIACVAIALGPHSIGDYFTETDFYGGYARGARLIQEGRLIPSRYTVVGPGYEMALALAGLLWRDLFMAAQILSALSAAATVVLWFHLLRRRIDATSAVAATLFYAANPTFLRYGYSATTDSFAVLLQVLALFLLLARPSRVPRETPRTEVSASIPSGRWESGWIFAAGVVAAAATLTRYTAAILLPAGLIAIAADAAFRDERRRAALLYTAGFAVPVLAWLAWLWSAGGRPSSQHHHLIAFEAFARPRGMIWDVYERDLEPRLRSMADVIRYDPGALAARWCRNLVVHVWEDGRGLLGLPVAAALVAGTFLAARDRRLERVWPMVVVGALSYLALVPVPHGERYSLMILPTYTMLAGMAFGWKGLTMRKGRTPARVPWLALLLFLVPFGASSLASVRHQSQALKQLPREALACGRVLQTLKKPGDGVIARKPHVAYIGGTRSIPFPNTTTLGQLASYARETNARWLYVSYPEAESRPDYFPLIDTTGTISGLVPRCVTSVAPAVLYEIGPEFGPHATWVADPIRMNLRIARARLRLYPDDVEAMWLEAQMELMLGDWARSAATLERAALLDARGQEPLAAVRGRDSTRAGTSLARLLSTIGPAPRPLPRDDWPGR